MLYYAPTIFEAVGFESHFASTLATVGLGVVKVMYCINVISGEFMSVYVNTTLIQQMYCIHSQLS